MTLSDELRAARMRVNPASVEAIDLRAENAVMREKLAQTKASLAHAVEVRDRALADLEAERKARAVSDADGREERQRSARALEAERALVAQGSRRNGPWSHRRSKRRPESASRWSGASRGWSVNWPPWTGGLRP